MSSADEAFDSLMGKQALAIPVANPLPAASLREETGGQETARQETERPLAEGVPEIPWTAGGSAAGGAMRVSDMIDDEAEYSPPSEDEGRTGATPTEADLEMVGDEPPLDEVDAARVLGARVAGRDAAAATTDDEDGIEADEAEFREAAEVDDSESDGEIVSSGGGGSPGSGLDRARRLKRFAYLPLSGAEAFDEAARDMFTRLPAAAPDRPSLAVTSAARGEGRTELAVRLALAMARRVGAKILLADFDLHRPQVAARLGVSTKYFTLADALRGSCMLGEALTVSEEDNLYVLPARAADREGDEILDSRAVAALIGRLHAAFDFTIIDCAPVDSPEAAVLCGAAGSAVLAGYCGRSSAVAMRAAAARLTGAGARLAGIALTGA